MIGKPAVGFDAKGSSSVSIGRRSAVSPMPRGFQLMVTSFSVGVESGLDVSRIALYCNYLSPSFRIPASEQGELSVSDQFPIIL